MDGRINFNDLVNLYNKCADVEMEPHYLIFPLDHAPQQFVDMEIEYLDEDGY